MVSGESEQGTDWRRKKLQWALKVAEESIAEADADKRSPLLGQYRAMLAEIAELSAAADSTGGEVNGLVILQEELAKRRQSGASPSRSSSRRRV